MDLTLDEVLQKAVEAHKAGQVQEADRLYTAILQAQPKHPDANHNMGVLAVNVNKMQEALAYFKAALESNPGIDQYWISYIDALIQLDQIVDAQTVLIKLGAREPAVKLLSSWNKDSMSQIKYRKKLPPPLMVKTQ
ncbi:tetratricopeptide repeat protein [Candidatus Njordibacter sp. Uisw_058]|uniref:tetratricopeptide repeat protein n=1 Tax=Candidatus Njordibacter sp. Uisw_058 TaxID=3230974 RepID=UPI003D45C766